MTQSADYYKVLGVPRGAEEKEIKSAYRKLARKYHPDVNPGSASASEKFKEVQAAYEVLGNPEKRKMYDRFGHQWENVQQAQEQGAGFGQDMGDLFQHMGGSGGSIFDFFTNMGGVGGAQGGPHFHMGGQAASYAPQNVEKGIEISLEDVDKGTSRVLTYQTLNQQTSRGVTQMVPENKRVEIKIPAGIANGGKLRVAGKGTSGLNGRAGDLIVTVHWQNHPKFKPVEDHLETDVDVPFAIAALGGEIRVQTLRKEISMTIPKGTQSGQVFRLAGHGLTRLGRGVSDLYARVKITVPRNLTAAQQATIKQLQDQISQGI